MIKRILFACFLLVLSTSPVHSQIIGGGGGGDTGPVQFFATNNSGFVQNGPMGPNDLVLLSITPEPPEKALLPAPFAIVGTMGSGQDLDGNGFEDSLGNFSGLEWVTGRPGVGNLIGCVLNDDQDGGAGNGEFYEIDPSNGDSEFIGVAPSGLVVQLVPNGPVDDLADPPTSVYNVPFPLPFGTAPLIGGSGQGLTLAYEVSTEGFVEDLVVLNPGEGYQVGDVVRIQGGNFQDNTFLITEVDGSQFDDLAFNPVTNRMIAIRNNGAGNDFGLNTLWVDSDGDNIPDEVSSIILLFSEFAKPQFDGLAETLVGGICFDEFGFFYLYDAVNEVIYRSLAPGDPSAIAPLQDVGIETSGLEVGNGLAFANQRLFIATDTPTRNSILSFYDVPEDPAMPPDPEPEVTPVLFFGQQFVKNGLVPEVTVGDMVAAEADLEDLPPTFPDNVVINNGTGGPNAVLEAVVVSDDFRFDIAANAPSAKLAPVDASFVFTIPNPSEVTVLGVDIESTGNVGNLEHTILGYNVQTGQFDELGTASVNSIGDGDGTVTIDLSTVISDYLNTSNGTLTIRIQTRTIGPVFFFPWSVLYDSVLAVSE